VVFMRPLARWTIGCVNKNGEETLRQSIRSFRRLHPEFDQVVCYNNLKIEQIDRLQRLGVSLYKQSEIDCPCKLTSVEDGLAEDWSMPGWGWKLAPPRLRFGAWELWIDNDIIFQQRVPSLEQWLSVEKAIISSAWMPKYGRFMEDDGEPVCAGFFGLPPEIDFSKEITTRVSCIENFTLGYWDEQGLVVSIVKSMPYIVVPMSELLSVKNLNKPYPAAMHFIGVNRTKEHYSWNQYQCSITLT
jgi:hypothetical protein